MTAFNRVLSDEEIKALYRDELPEVPRDGEWHNVKYEMSGDTIDAMHLDGHLVYATREYLQAKGGEK